MAPHLLGTCMQVCGLRPWKICQIFHINGEQLILLLLFTPVLSFWFPQMETSPHWRNKACHQWGPSQCREISRWDPAPSGSPISPQSLLLVLCLAWVGYSDSCRYSHFTGFTCRTCEALRWAAWAGVYSVSVLGHTFWRDTCIKK